MKGINNMELWIRSSKRKNLIQCKALAILEGKDVYANDKKCYEYDKYIICELCGGILGCLWFFCFEENKDNSFWLIILIFLKCFLGSFLYGIGVD